MVLNLVLFKFWKFSHRISASSSSGFIIFLNRKYQIASMLSRQFQQEQRNFRLDWKQWRLKSIYSKLGKDEMDKDWELKALQKYKMERYETGLNRKGYGSLESRL